MLARHAAQLRRAFEKAWKEIQLLQEQRSIDEEDELQNEPSDDYLKRRLDAAMMMPLPGKHSALPTQSLHLRS